MDTVSMISDGQKTPMTERSSLFCDLAAAEHFQLVEHLAVSGLLHLTSLDFD